MSADLPVACRPAVPEPPFQVSDAGDPRERRSALGPVERGTAVLCGHEEPRDIRGEIHEILRERDDRSLRSTLRSHIVHSPSNVHIVVEPSALVTVFHRAAKQPRNDRCAPA